MRKGTDVKLYEKTLHKESKKQKARRKCENTPCFDEVQSCNYKHLIKLNEDDLLWKTTSKY